VKTLLITASAGALVAAALALPMALSSAGEARPAPSAKVVATVDVGPIQDQLAALRAELMVLRQSVSDPKGLRSEIAGAAAAVKAMDGRLNQIAELVKEQSKSLAPIITALDPATKWEYRCLRSRSETVCNRLGREGWQLVTGSEDWLFFRRPLPVEEKQEKRGED
jgi:hypothetical protein